MADLSDSTKSATAHTKRYKYDLAGRLMETGKRGLADRFVYDVLEERSRLQSST
jgi:hypothetical protein